MCPCACVCVPAPPGVFLPVPVATLTKFRSSETPRHYQNATVSLAMRLLKATLFLALVASLTGVIIRGPNVTYDTYIRAGNSITAPIINYATTNFNAQTQGWWDGPLTISATQVISGVTTDTSALLIKFDLRSFVGATLVPGKPAWLNYFVSDSGGTASLRELVRPWNEVRTPTAKTRALPSQPRAAPWLRPLPNDAPSPPLPAFDSPQSRGTTSHLHRHRGGPPTFPVEQPEPSQASLAGIGLTCPPRLPRGSRVAVQTMAGSCCPLAATTESGLR